MKTLCFLLTAALFVLLFSCIDEVSPDSELLYVNNSDQVLVFWEPTVLEDSSLAELSHIPYETPSYELFVVAPGDTAKRKGAYIHSLEEKVRDMHVFIFDRDTLEQVPWERVVSEYKVLRRYDLTLDSLERRNWIITYP